MHLTYLMTPMIILGIAQISPTVPYLTNCTAGAAAHQFSLLSTISLPVMHLPFTTRMAMCTNF
uniref:Uncharacterized protein n=1 Tax=Rhizophora mucronata TaxID=61149 RepID=A0A2P2N1B1_RHIMU